MTLELGKLLTEPTRGDALQAVHEPGDSDGRWEADEQMDVLGLTVELLEAGPEVCADIGHDLLHPSEMPGGEDLVAVFGHEHQVSVQQKDAMPACTNIG